MDGTEIGWGFVGTGGIAQTVASALELAPGGRLAAVCSRELGRAERFAADRDGHDVAAYDDVEAMLADPSVDVVYVATTHPQHHAPARAALRVGKPVLVEKPMTASLAATRDLVELARQRGVLLVEAYWTRFLPGTTALLEVVGSGAVGEVLGVHADFGFPAPESLRRFHDPQLGGGSLLDLGPYPVGLALTLLGTPSGVEVTGSLTPSGVDRQVALALAWPSGAVAALSTTMAARTASRAWIEGDRGWIEVDAPFHEVPRFTVRTRGADGAEHVEVHEHAVAHGHRFVLEHVHALVAAGEVESPLVPLGFSLDLAAVFEQALTRLGAERALELGDALP
ncbi:Gfo/Idh/MocA family protein [Kineococcus sp. SYSU DK006]|uniref:Gfo/Idh/MocA family protein n=1 Tax=Kineococcus sp. SYSU DK006 TaxID=3383127 RepID=UPI003D7C638D